METLIAELAANRAARPSVLSTIGAVASIFPAATANGASSLCHRGRRRRRARHVRVDDSRTTPPPKKAVSAQRRSSFSTKARPVESPPTSDSSGVFSTDSRKSSAASRGGFAPADVAARRRSSAASGGSTRTKLSRAESSTRLKRQRTRSIDSGGSSSAASAYKTAAQRGKCYACGGVVTGLNESTPRVFLDGLTIDTSRAKSNAPVVSLCAQRLRMIERKEPSSQPCDVYWHNVNYADMRAVVRAGGARARVNRFPGMSEVARKAALTQAVRSMAHLFPSEYAFYPRSWVLPAQLDEFRAHCAVAGTAASGAVWRQRVSLPAFLTRRQSSAEDANGGRPRYYIVKPDDGAQGAGIYLARSPADLRGEVLTCRQLVQEYVDPPYLLADGLKFDFRVYAIIKSINPLSVYVAREGMARFCTSPYFPPTPGNFENLFSHLTNYTLNKSNGAYIHSKSLKEQIQGSKRLLSTVFHQMEARGVDTRKLWHKIKQIVVRTVLAMVPELMLSYEHYFAGCEGPQCFQILGFDIIVRADGTPLLLEVNAAPSLSIQHQNGISDALLPPLGGVQPSQPQLPPVRSIVDEMIKLPLVYDCLLLVSNRLSDEYPLISAVASTTSRDEYTATPRKTFVQWEQMLANNSHVLSALNGQPKAVAGSRRPIATPSSEDDIGVLRRKRKPHLTEVFPGRGGAAERGRQLLLLDRAVYLFMQFVNVKQTLHITLSALRAFLRKCNLSDLLTGKELEELFNGIHRDFTGRDSDPTSGLSFHGFLQVLFHVARHKFVACDDNLAAFLRLLAFCDSALRYYGVRSTRLRHTELTRHADTENSNTTEIYLLPNRLRQHQLPHDSDGEHEDLRCRLNGAGIPSRRSRSVPR